MSVGFAVCLFSGSLLLALIASAGLSKRLDQVGTRLGVSEGLLGLITALGADSPEIATAVTALVSGNHDLGRGVIFGSNIFNLAALFGFSTLVAGQVVCGRGTLFLNAGVSILVTAVVAWQTVTTGSPLVSGVLLAVIMVPYMIVSALKTSQLLSIAALSPAIRGLYEALRDASVGSGDERVPEPSSGIDVLAIVPILAMVVASSIGMVRAATVLAPQVGVSEAVLGTLVLAATDGHSECSCSNSACPPKAWSGGGERDLQQQQPKFDCRRLRADAVHLDGAVVSVWSTDGMVATRRHVSNDAAVSTPRNAYPMAWSATGRRLRGFRRMYGTRLMMRQLGTRLRPCDLNARSKALRRPQASGPSFLAPARAQKAGRRA